MMGLANPIDLPSASCSEKSARMSQFESMQPVTKVDGNMTSCLCLLNIVPRQQIKESHPTLTCATPPAVLHDYKTHLHDEQQFQCDTSTKEETVSP